MKVKKLTIYLLIAAMAFGTVSCKKSIIGPKVTEENFREFPETDGSMFNVDDIEGGVRLGRCKSKLKDKVIVVPEKIGGEEVIAVEMGAFYESEAEAIVLPDTVRVIEESAFLGCEDLKYVYLGAGLKETGDMVFNYCKSIEKIELPEGVERINGIIAFNCPALKEIIVPASVTDIPNGIMLSEDFDGVIKTPAGSAAEKAALEEGLKVENY